jgi:superfamily I DNA/RNA helicase
MRKIIYGPPGTGKTWTLLNEVEKYLKETPPNKIGYFTFSKNAAREGKERAMNKFKLSDDDLPYFQTLHSFCYNQIELNTNQVMKSKHYKEFGEIVDIEKEEIVQDNDQNGVFHSKNPYMQLINVARSKDMDPIEYYHIGADQKLSLNKLQIIYKELKKFKKEKGLVDFHDMLERFLNGHPETGDQYKSPNLRVAFIDEAQDLSWLQWKLVYKIEESSTESVIAGDDDQAIYRWNGAHVNTFINLEGERKILEQSRRVPRKPFELANKIISQVKDRVEKKYYPKDQEGSVHRCQNLYEIDFTKGRWLVLATANYMLEEIGIILDEKGLYWQRRNATPRVRNIYDIIQKWEELKKGVPLHYNDCKKIKSKMDNNNWDTKFFKAMSKDKFYDIDILKEKFGLNIEDSWEIALNELFEEDIKKINKLINAGEDLSKAPRISLSTIHGVKGNERENVVVHTELSGSAFEEYQINPDDTHRLFYVACTRTEDSLYIIEPKTKKAYDI